MGGGGWIAAGAGGREGGRGRRRELVEIIIIYRKVKDTRGKRKPIERRSRRVRRGGGLGNR